MSSCLQCEFIKPDKKRCQRKANCRKGNKVFCWQHAEAYILEKVASKSKSNSKSIPSQAQLPALLKNVTLKDLEKFFQLPIKQQQKIVASYPNEMNFLMKQLGMKVNIPVKQPKPQVIIPVEQPKAQVIVEEKKLKSILKNIDQEEEKDIEGLLNSSLNQPQRFPKATPEKVKKYLQRKSANKKKVTFRKDTKPEAAPQVIVPVEQEENEASWLWRILGY
jgi:hypothetical protein